MTIRTNTQFRILALACACALFATTDQAKAEPVAYPGSNWSALTGPSGASGAERDNILLQGRIEQGIDWVRFGTDNKLTLNTFASAAYSVDTRGLDYNNKFAPAFGMKVRRSFDSGVLDVGVQLVNERRWKSKSDATISQVFISYWFGWDLKK